MTLLPVLPILIPAVTAAFSFVLWRYRFLQRLLGLAGTASLLAAGLVLLWTVEREGILVHYLGNWPAPFGITLVADLFSAIMVVMAGIMGLAVAIYSLADIDTDREFFGYYPFLQILLMGVCGCFLTGDLFNLYVWFEVMLMASFILLALGGERAQLEGAIKYVTLNLVGSAFFLSALGILYGLAGTLNMADLARHLPELIRPGLASTLAMLFLAAFGIKAALFPFFFWLPASYHTPPVAVSAIFAGLLTKVGVYSLIRVFTLLFVQDVGYTHNLILVIAVLTMVTGVLGAVAQNEFRRLLSFHIISQVGYMVLGLALFTPLALAGSIFYIVHNIFAKANLFLVSGVVLKLRGTNDLGRLGGLYAGAPGLSALFLISALALAGLPPLSGFWAKLFVVWAALQTEHYLAAAAALAVGMLTLFSMTKIWGKVFWGKRTDDHSGELDLPLSTRLSFYLPMVLLATLTVGIGLLVEPVYSLSAQAADQLLNPAGYVQAVLGDGP
ncbi:MAG: Na+/H+ antiporter subunit D [Desulfuromonadales bacterium]